MSDSRIPPETRRRDLAWNFWHQCLESRIELAKARGDAEVQCDGGDDRDLGHGLGPLVAVSVCAHLMVQGCRDCRAPNIEQEHSSVGMKTAWRDEKYGYFTKSCLIPAIQLRTSCR